MSEDPVVITGAGMVTSLGHTAAETWQALLAGESGVKAIEGFCASGFKCRSAAQAQALDLRDLDIHPRWARIMDLHSRMLSRCAYDAFRQAQLGSGAVTGEEIGCFVGMGNVDYKIEDFVGAVQTSTDGSGGLDMAAFYSRGYQEINPLITLMLLNNVSLCQAAIGLNIKGENAVFSPHADSGAQAIIEGARAVMDRKAKAVLAGGVSEKVCALSLARAELQGILRADVEAAACGGTVLGEGCGIVALEARSSAEARGAEYGAMIAGYGRAFGAHEGSPAASGAAIARAMNKALESAGLHASQIDVVIAHEDGTPVGDGNEIEAIDAVFASCLDRLSVFSSKPALGHLLAGAPGVDIILGSAIIAEGVVPPTFNSSAEGGGFHPVSGGPQRTGARRVMVNCRSFEGQCASVILERASEGRVRSP